MHGVRDLGHGGKMGFPMLGFVLLARRQRHSHREEAMHIPGVGDRVEVAGLNVPVTRRIVRGSSSISERSSAGNFVD
jgi:hypothetical protein